MSIKPLTTLSPPWSWWATTVANRLRPAAVSVPGLRQWWRKTAIFFNRIDDNHGFQIFQKSIKSDYFEVFFPLRVYFPKTLFLFLKFVLQSSCFLFRGMVRNGIWESLLLFLFHGTEFRVVFSSAEGFGREFREIASIFVPWTEFGVFFLFPWRVWKGIPRACFYFCSTVRNSELFSLTRKGSERNSESFCSAEQPEFRRK